MNNWFQIFVRLLMGFLLNISIGTVHIIRKVIPTRVCTVLQFFSITVTQRETELIAVLSDYVIPKGCPHSLCFLLLLKISKNTVT